MRESTCLQDFNPLAFFIPGSFG